MLGPQNPLEPAQPSPRAAWAHRAPGRQVQRQPVLLFQVAWATTGWSEPRQDRWSVPLVQSRGWGSGGNQRAQPQTPEQERERGEDIRELSSCFLTVHSQPKLALANRKHLINIGWMDAWMHGFMKWWMEWIDGMMDGWMDGWMVGWMDGWNDGWMEWWVDPRATVDRVLTMYWGLHR